MLNDILQDLKFGLRTLAKHRIFSLVAVLTIAIGIGVNVLVFTLVERILLSSLPYPEPHRLVQIRQSYPEQGLPTWGISPASFARYHNQNRSLEAMAVYYNAGTVLTGTDTPEYLQVGRVTADFFKVFGVAPVLGRTFAPDEDTEGKSAVVVLSYGLWQRRFGGDTQIIGRSLELNDVSTQVIGVMPASFKFPLPDTDLWTPVVLNPQRTSPFIYTGIARLRSGQTAATAASDTTAVLWNGANENPKMVLRQSPPPPGTGLKTLVTPLKETIIGKVEKPLLILQIAVGFVLLIACANVANLLLSRATRRTQEIALRLALGATRWRVIRQLLTESLLLALFGSAVGVALAWASVRALSRGYVQAIPRIEEARVSGKVLIVTIGLTALTGILFGIVPALRASWLGLKNGVNEGQKGSSGSANKRLNSALVALQLSFSLVLLICAGLMLKSFQRLLAFNPGYDPDKVLTMTLAVSNKKYPEPEQGVAAFKRLLESVRTVPGVNGAAVSSTIPLGGKGARDGHIVEGQEPKGEEAPQAELKVVGAGFFKTLGMPILKGREFLDSDTEKTPLVAVVDQKFAEQYWPNGDPLGKRIRTLDPDWYTIVGVVPTVKAQVSTLEAVPQFYMSFGQVAFGYAQQGRMNLIVNTNNPNAVKTAIREQVKALDPDVPVYAVNTISEIIGNGLQSHQLISMLLTAFSAVALLLAAIGTYGVLSVFVSSRESEFAIRMALGAHPRKLLLSILGQGLVLAAIGTAFGLLGGWAGTRLMSSWLIEVSTVDPFIFILTPAVLIFVTLLACYLPARRAARTNPAQVLRNA
ncbi:MAG TPA: ABC transporter permease [Pyrinomonadaceae bacterium]|nr:ABC transporter permease [Pyrinomonadaceae bacterium]